MAKPKITVVGSFAVGLTIRAPNIPVFGVTMFGSNFDMGPGGKGSNQAVATARLGADSSLVAIIGQDKLADIATDLYKVEGVGTRFLEQTAESPTGVGFIILNDKGENACEPEIEFTRQPTPEGGWLSTFPWGYVIWLVIATTSGWVYRDAKKNRIEGNSPLVWFIGCLAVWIISFPWYLITRNKQLSERRDKALMDAARAGATAGSGGGASPPPA